MDFTQPASKAKIGMFIHIGDDGDDWNSITTHDSVKTAKEVLYSFVSNNWSTFDLPDVLYDLEPYEALEYFFNTVESSYVICELGSLDLDNSVTYKSSN